MLISKANRRTNKQNTGVARRCLRWPAAPKPPRQRGRCCAASRRRWAPAFPARPPACREPPSPSPAACGGRTGRPAAGSQTVRRWAGPSWSGGKEVGGALSVSHGWKSTFELVSYFVVNCKNDKPKCRAGQSYFREKCSTKKENKPTFFAKILLKFDISVHTLSLKVNRKKWQLKNFNLLMFL